jgi:hypothetical protein
MIRYRDAKCQFHMKMAVIPKFKKNLEIFLELTKAAEGPNPCLKRQLRGMYYNMIASKNRSDQGDILEALGTTVRGLPLP